MTLTESIARRTDVRDRPILGFAPIVLVGLALFVSWFAHGMDEKGAPAILLLLIVCGGYGLAKAVLGRHVLPALLFVLAIIALHAIGQVLIVLITTGQLARPSDTNVLATVMLAGVILSLKHERRVMAGLFAAALILSGSRGGLLAAGAAWCFAYFSGVVKLPRWTLIVIGAGILFTWVVWFNTHGSLGARLSVWSSALNMWADSWWVGQGPGAFYSLASPMYPHAHNIFMQAAADLGWAGLIAIISVVGFYMLAIEKSIAPRWGWALLAALLVEGMFDFIYWVPQASILLLLIADEVIGVSAVSEYDAASASSPDNRWSAEVHPPPA